MANNDHNGTRNPLHEDYAKTQDKPSNKELVARRERICDILPDNQALSQNPDFIAGKLVEFNGMKVAIDRQPGSTFGEKSDKVKHRDIEYRRLGDGFAVHQQGDPNRTNFAQISKSDGHTNMTASYKAEPAQIQASLALELATLTSTTSQDIIHKSLTVESRGAMRDHRRRPKASPYNAAYMKRQAAKEKREHAEREKAQTPYSDKCANCNQFGHTVSNCWGPTDKYGFIDACPCNGPFHRSDQCTRVAEWSNFLKYQVFFLSRICLPPLKHEESFAYLIAYDPIIRQLHEVVKVLMRTGCPGDLSLSWRYNPLTFQFCIRTWNVAQPWKHHDYSKPQERWCNLPDPAYTKENWLQQAINELPLNPLEQSFVNNKKTRPLPGMTPTWQKMKEIKNVTNAESFSTFQRLMKAWSDFYMSMVDPPTVYMEFLIQKLTKLTEKDLHNISRQDPRSCNKLLEDMYRESQGKFLPAKPGIGVPQVPQNEFQMQAGVFFIRPATQSTISTVSAQQPGPPPEPPTQEDTQPNTDTPDLQVEELSEDQRRAIQMGAAANHNAGFSFPK